MKHMKLSWTDPSSAQQTTALTLAAVQLSLAVTAWVNLATRPLDKVNGRKAVWAAIIAVNFVGPALYFAKGSRKKDP